MSDLQIYNCHIHVFTSKNVPRNFLILACDEFFGAERVARHRFLHAASTAGGTLFSWFLRWQWFTDLLIWLGRDSRLFANNDLIKRYARLLETGRADSPEEIFEAIQKQYPPDTRFIILPMDMECMDLGAIEEPIDKQHAQLLSKIIPHWGARVIPFYAADPRRKTLIEDVRANLTPDKFRGLKIYPNLGYFPQDEKLMPVYAICEERNVPVMTHCSTGGIWQRGLSYSDRVRLSHPSNYEMILQKHPRLRLCLAHFGGSEEWDKHLQSRADRAGPERAWVRWIADLICSGQYPNLYTDISYLVFQPRPRALHVDYFDYLKVLLADERLRQRVLFGSDYYISERELITEKEVSIALRSRLGEELYFQIAHHNPNRYLGLA
jgi:predicted TIM-barrel fold metal-dependent hydrolase